MCISAYKSNIDSSPPFAQRMYHIAPWPPCQRTFFMQWCLVLRCMRQICMKVSELWPNMLLNCSSWPLPYPVSSHRTGWWSSPDILLDRPHRCDGSYGCTTGARPEFADHLYFHYERQESEQRPTKRAFGRANSGLVFQEAQLLDPFSVPKLNLLYGDKSFSGAHRGHYPIYGEESEDGKNKNAKYAYFQFICKKHANMQLQSHHHDESHMFFRENFECAWGSTS